ncbi:hypothetical protein E8E13_001458 [Curvularia kusanoi]|uniref:Uncharacterized protein n=1 Tax=Curvularia kusanoi TaxID=90978 RepID=A0A9P4T2V1_CURKU|nr:hypothetical protein E8E13_001458 [Curvularia kusanoi]
MADIPHAAVASQSTTSFNVTNTTHPHSTWNESSTQYQATQIHSPAGPQYDDLPPSYDFALSNARSSGISGTANRIEAHLAGADEGHVSTEPVAGSQSTTIGQTGDLISSSSSPTLRDASSIAEPSHSTPTDQSDAHSRDNQGPRGRECRGHRSRSSQDLAAFGQNVGKWGSQFGRKMSAIGKQFGQRTEQWASAYSAGGGGYNPPPRPMRVAAGSGTVEPSGPPQYDHPPSYEAPAAEVEQNIGLDRSPSPVSHSAG